MEDQQQPPDKAAMVEGEQKPGEAAAAMVEDQIQKKPDEAAAAMERYPVEEVFEAVAFLDEITASLEGDPDVREGLVDLLVGFGKGLGEARDVASILEALLEGHPDVLGRFTAFLTRAKTPAAAVPPAGPLAVTRTRRSTTRRSKRDGQPCRALPAVKEEPDAAQDNGSPRKGEAGGVGDRKRQDPRLAEANAFLKRVENANDDVWKKFSDVLKLHAGDKYADDIYGDAKDALGPEHAALLDEFASTFLPGQKEWEEQERRREAKRDRRRAARRAIAADNQRPPRADDDYYNDGNHRQDGLRIGGGESSGGGGGGTAVRGELDRHHEVVKKKRCGDDDNNRRHDDDNYVPRVRIKMPRTDDGGGHRRDAVSNNGEPSSSGAVLRLRVPNGDVQGYGDKKPRRRAPNGVKGSSAAVPPPPETEPTNRDAMFRRFRKLCVFYTHYSTLVETMARVRELLNIIGDGGGSPTSVEELFPDQKQRDLLASYYGNNWGEMRVRLEGGKSTVPALEEVLRRLKLREAEAVAKEARQRRLNDAERAVEQVVGLVADTVRHEVPRHRLDAGDGGASSGKRARPPAVAVCRRLDYGPDTT